MKKTKIGKVEYDEIESMMDINDERFMIFRQYLLQALEGMDKPLFATTYTKLKSMFNSGDHWGVPMEIENYRKAIELKELNYDAYSFCYALLMLAPGEDQKDFSQAKQLDKLKIMREAGLKRGIVEEKVINFMKASPNTFGAYLKVLELMKAPLLEEI